MNTPDPADPWARWSTDRGVWVHTSLGPGPCGHLRPCTAPWPTSGAIQGRRAVALPPPERPDRSPHQLPPTPSVGDGTGGHTSRSGNRSRELLLGGVARALAAARAHNIITLP